jgi:hypothetical protein
MNHFVLMRELEAEVWTKWRGLVSEQTQSGQRAAKFCRERGVALPLNRGLARARLIR